METKSREMDTPPHKLAENFRARLLINGQLQEDGEIDLRASINAMGVVRNAPHNHAPAERLSGEAHTVTLPDGRETLAITLQTADRSATYTGVLLLDADNKLFIGGFFKFDSSIRRRALADPAQNEGVWIITKP
jgi:hypothetical protein